MQKLKYAVLAVIILVIIGIVGNMDFEDQLKEETQYCNDTIVGLYPDYRGVSNFRCFKGK